MSFSNDISKNLITFATVLSTLLGLMVLSACGDEEPEPIPTITSFTPESGIAGDTVQVFGENFSELIGENFVELNGVQAVVLSASATQLTIEVPVGSSTGKISVTVNKQSSSSESNFRVFQSPEITNFMPAFGPVGAEVTITGNNFSINPGDNAVTFNDVVATVAAAGETSLTVLVPNGAVTGRIGITVNGLSTTSAIDFVVPPIIENFLPASGVIGSSVEIVGSGFSEVVTENTVMFNGVVASVLSATANSLTVTVPELASSGKITITVNDQTVLSPEDYVVLPVISDFSPKNGAIGSTVVIQGSGFSISPSGNIVEINGIVALVKEFTSTSIAAEVPVGSATGKITVTTGGNAVTSEFDFNVVVEAAIAGGSDFDQGASIGVDGSGNAYVLGSFRGLATFGATAITANGSDDIFIAKYDSNCDLVWVKQIGGASSDNPASIIVDVLGNSYVSGTVDGQAFFDGTAKGGNGRNLFVAKLNASGDIVWVSIYTSFSSQVPSFSSISLSQSGNLYLTGAFAESISIESSNLTSSGATDILVLKLNSASGSVVWAKSIGGTASEFGSAIEVNSNNEVFLAGSFFETIALGDKSLTAVGSLDAFVSKMDADGNIVWVSQLGGNNYDNIYSLAADNQGNLVAAGYFTGAATIGSSPISAQGNEDILLAKFNGSSGELLWVKSEGGSNYDNARSVELDSNGNIYVTGHFTTSVSFGEFGLTTEMNNPDVFVVKYGSDGEVIWAKSAGGLENDWGKSLILGSTGIVHITGSFNGTATFGSTTFTGAGNDDSFVWRIWSE